MKKAFAVMLVLVLSLSLFACANTNSEEDNYSDQTFTHSNTEITEADSNEVTLSHSGIDFTIGEKLSSVTDLSNVTYSVLGNGETIDDMLDPNEDRTVRVYSDDFEFLYNGSMYERTEEDEIYIDLGVINDTGSKVAIKDATIDDIFMEFPGSEIFGGALTLKHGGHIISADLDDLGLKHNPEAQAIIDKIQQNVGNPDVNIGELKDSVFDTLGKNEYIEFTRSEYEYGSYLGYTVYYNNLYYWITGWGIKITPYAEDI